MRITPLDIRKQEFRKAMRGLDAEEVYAFLSTIGDEYETVLNDNKALRERLLELDDKVQEYRTMEKTLRDTLLTAERVNVEAKDNARREAELIIKEAQIEAEKALRNIKNEAIHLRQEVHQLRGQRESYLARMKVIAESLLKFIENADADFRKEDDAITAQIEGAETVTKPEPVNSDLFDAADQPADDPVVPETDAITPSDPRKAREPGVPQEVQNKGRGVIDSHSTPEPRDPRYRERPPADGAEPSAPMTDLNDILDRMAGSQREITNPDVSEPEPRPVPRPAPKTPAAQHDHPSVRVGNAREEARTHTGSSENRSELPPLSPSDPFDGGPEGRPAGSTVPTGNDVTSEWSLEQIRKDLMGGNDESDR